MPYDYIEEYQKQNDETIWLFRDKDAQEKIDTSSTETDYANPLSLETMQAQLAENTKIKIEPIQDLHGYDKPWVGGAGKNLLAFPYAWKTSKTSEDITYIPQPDGSILIKAGTAAGTGNAIFRISDDRPNWYEDDGNQFDLPIGDYIISINVNIPGVFVFFNLNRNGSNYQIARSDTKPNFSMTSEYANLPKRIGLQVDSGTVISQDILVYPMIRLATETDSSFAPYTNICPILPHEEIKIGGCGKNLLPKDYELTDRNGITHSVNDDGTFILTGTTTSKPYYAYIRSINNPLPVEYGQNYVVSFLKNGTLMPNISKVHARVVKVKNGVQGSDMNANNGIISFTVDDSFDSIFIYINAEDTGIDMSGTYAIQLEIGTSNTSYSPYTISNNLSIDLSSTVYGGVLDLESGILTIDKAIKDLSEMSFTFSSGSDQMWFSSPTLASVIKYDNNNYLTKSVTSIARAATRNSMVGDAVFCVNNAGSVLIRYSAYNNDVPGFMNAVAGQKICYELSTPFTLYISPEQLKLLKSQNNLTTSQYTQIKVTYRNGVFATLEELSDTANGIYDEISGDATIISGNPINFTTREKQKSKSTIIDLEPIQDLHGYSKPWVGGAGKNKLPMTVEWIKASNVSGTWNGNVYTINNIAFTILTDSDNNIIGIKANGTPNANTNFYVNRATGSYLLSLLGSNTSYILNGCPSGGSATSYYLRFAQISPWSAIATDIGNGLTYSTSSITDSSSTLYTYIIGVDSGTTVNNIIFYPMIRLSTVTDSSFEPYTNIASISGRSSIDIDGCGKNLIESVENGTWTTANQGKSASTNRARSIKLIMVKSSTQYCISAKSSDSKTIQTIAQFYSDIGEDTFISETSGWENVSRSFITPENCKYIAIIFRTSNNDNNPENYMLEAQLEENNQASLYEPYTPSTDLTISFGTTVYGGRLDVEKGELVIDRDIVDLDDFTWTYSSAANELRWYSNTFGAKYKTYESSQVPNSVFEEYETTSIQIQNANVNKSNATVYGNRIYIRNLSSTIEPSGNAILELVDSYKTTIQLTPQQVQLLKGINNISTTGTTITVTFKNGSVAHLDDLPENVFTDLDKEKLASIDTLAVTLDLLTHTLIVTQDV